MNSPTQWLHASAIACLVTVLVTFGSPEVVCAQTNYLGLQVQGDKASVSRISVVGDAVVVGQPKEIRITAGRGHISGRFIKGEPPVLLSVRRLHRKTLRFSASTSNGKRISRIFNLSRPIGDHYQILSGFDYAHDGVTDLAIVDRSKRQLRWVLVENPLEDSAREIGSYLHGSKNDPVE